MPEATLREIMLMLGELRSDVQGVRRDFAEEKVYTRQSRQETKDRLGKIEETVSIVGKTAAQARDEGAALKEMVVSEIKPSTDEFKRIKALGLGWTGIVGFGGVAIGASLANPIMQVIAAIRGWLS